MLDRIRKENGMKRVVLHYGANCFGPSFNRGDLSYVPVFRYSRQIKSILFSYVIKVGSVSASGTRGIAWDPESGSM